MLVAKAGLLTTVQDLGRWGYQSFGVSVAGPMDRFSHRLANLLVGNSTSAAGLEITLLGPDIEFQDDVRCAVTGAEFEIFVDGNQMPLNATWIVPKGAHLRFGRSSTWCKSLSCNRRWPRCSTAAWQSGYPPCYWYGRISWTTFAGGRSVKNRESKFYKVVKNASSPIGSVIAQ